jgi:hypothetical protein
MWVSFQSRGIECFITIAKRKNGIKRPMDPAGSMGESISHKETTQKNLCHQYPSSEPTDLDTNVKCT